jgi:hypothetical protein
MRLSNVSARQPRDSEAAMAGETPDDVTFQRDMQAAQKRLESGDLTAFAQAVRLCWRHRRHPPLWLMEASKTLVERAWEEDKKRARREWAIHRARWEALVELRERRHELKQRGDDRGMTWDDAREAVSEALEKDEAAGSAAAIKESYELIQDAGGEGATFQDFLDARHRRHVRRQEQRQQRDSKLG